MANLKMEKGEWILINFNASENIYANKDIRCPYIIVRNYKRRRSALVRISDVPPHILNVVRSFQRQQPIADSGT
jgi:hypothetical protein